MRELVEFVMDGGTIMAEVEVPEVQQALVRASRTKEGIVLSTEQKFDEAIDVARPAAQGLVTKLRDLGDEISPETIEVEFGLKLDFKAGAVIASSGAEANFKIKLSWKRDAQPE